MVAAGEPEELPVEVLLQEDCAAAVDFGVGRGGDLEGSFEVNRLAVVAVQEEGNQLLCIAKKGLCCCCRSRCWKRWCQSRKR